MNIEKIARETLGELKKDLNAAKFTPQEWADVELAVAELAFLTDYIGTADENQLPGLERRMRMAKALLRNYTLAKGIEVEGAVQRAIGDALRRAIGIGVATLEKILVAT